MNIYKKIIDLFKIIIVVIFCLNSCLFSAKAQSSNVTATAADLSYNFLGLTAENKPTYEVKLHLYYHCINNNNIASLGFAPVALTYLSDTVVKQELFLALQDIQNATPLCVQNANDSNCDVGNINGMMRYTYSNISEPLILNEVGKNWELHFSEVSRNPEITNIQNPNSVNLYVKAIIYNNNGQIIALHNLII